MNIPVIDRAVLERVFRVGRRRAIQLMDHFGGYQTGRTFVVDRQKLLQQLEPLEASAEFAMEQHRRQRLVDSLEQFRRARAGARVAISVPPVPQQTTLPSGVHLDCGTLRVEFETVHDLLGKLYALSQAAAADFESFRAAAEGTRSAGSSASAEAG
jgi:hypothetical protein